MSRGAGLPVITITVAPPGLLSYSHPGYVVLAPGQRPVYTDAVVCLAIPGRVLELVDIANHIATVEVVGVRRKINVGLLADADGTGPQPGDWVLIHVGFALSKIDEEEAHATLRLLERMGAEYEQELDELKASVIE